MKTKEPIEPPTTTRQTLTSAALAVEFGVSAQTMGRRLHEIGLKPGQGVKFTILQAFQALTNRADDESTMNEERLMKLREERKLLELERKKTEKALVAMDDVDELWNSRIMPIRQQWLAMPEALAARCNPTDPAQARAALDDWKENSMRLCRHGKQ